jgi:hypothetical protein
MPVQNANWISLGDAVLQVLTCAHIFPDKYCGNIIGLPQSKHDIRGFICINGAAKQLVRPCVGTYPIESGTMYRQSSEAVVPAGGGWIVQSSGLGKPDHESRGHTAAAVDAVVVAIVSAGPLSIY